MMREVAEFQKKYPNSARMPKDRSNLIYCLLMAISVVIFYAVPKLVWYMIPLAFRFDLSQIETPWKHDKLQFIQYFKNVNFRRWEVRFSLVVNYRGLEWLEAALDVTDDFLSL